MFLITITNIISFFFDPLQESKSTSKFYNLWPTQVTRESCALNYIRAIIVLISPLEFLSLTIIKINEAKTTTTTITTTTTNNNINN